METLQNVNKRAQASSLRSRTRQRNNEPKNLFTRKIGHHQTQREQNTRTKHPAGDTRAVIIMVTNEPMIMILLIPAPVHTIVVYARVYVASSAVNLFRYPPEHQSAGLATIKPNLLRFRSSLLQLYTAATARCMFFSKNETPTTLKSPQPWPAPRHPFNLCQQRKLRVNFQTIT